MARRVKRKRTDAELYGVEAVEYSRGLAELLDLEAPSGPVDRRRSLELVAALDDLDARKKLADLEAAASAPGADELTRRRTLKKRRRELRKADPSGDELSEVEAELEVLEARANVFTVDMPEHLHKRLRHWNTRSADERFTLRREYAADLRRFKEWRDSEADKNLAAIRARRANKRK